MASRWIACALAALGLASACVTEGTQPSDAEAAAWPTPTPLSDGTRFSASITHPFLPLSSVRYAELRSDDELVVREVLDETRRAGDVECLILAEKEYEDGELAEISYNYFAQDPEGNVWYFGEEVDDYEDGRVVGHGGAWLVGRNAVEPCLIMPAHPTVGLRFKSENSPPDAEEFDEVAAIDATLNVPVGAYRGVVVIREGDVAGKWKERKFYAAGVGLIRENEELALTKLGKD
ncbi:MAG: hypothetical protein HZA52_03160 [Planctomycetes bacterium]|nr:hypothetical protein [Planctomycetota bacterium]